MAIPSSLYAEDESARQTLQNGTVLKWTKQLQNIHVLNVETDLSIAYTNWANEPMMTHANRGFHQWQGGCTSGGDLGTNQSTGFTYQHATGIKQIEGGQPRIDDLQSHVVLSNGGGYYVWGYNPEASTRISGGNGDQRRYLLDMDINKMIFNCTIVVVDKSFFDNVDYTSNPENMPAPREHNITLKELYTHPELYYCTGVINWSNTYVYGSDTSDHWRGVTIRPVILLTGETIGEYQGADDSIFGRFNANGSFSYDSRDPNGHANFGGGGSSNTLYNHMNAGYFMGCKNEIDMTPGDTFDSAGGASTSIALAKWGNTNFNKFAYCNGQIFDYGDSVIWCSWGCRVANNTNTGSIYRDYTFGTRRYIKADKMLKYIASFGLYFMSEAFDPDTVNLTPETLGDDNRIMLGEMSADGTTTGRWITDIDSYHGPNKDGKTNNPSYDPSGGGGISGDEDIEVDMNLSASSFGAGLTHYYVCTKESAVLNTISDALGQWNIKDTGKDLFRNLISCKLARIGAIPAKNSTFVIYGEELLSDGSPISIQEITGNPTLTLGSIKIERKYNDFRDYAPFTKIDMFVPFCGWVPLPSHCIGRTVSGELIIDIIAGTCKAVIKCDRSVVAEAAGVCAIDIPFVAENAGMKMAGIANSIVSYGKAAAGAVGGVASAASGNPVAGGAQTAGSVVSVLGGLAQMYMQSNANYTEICGKTADGCNTGGLTAVYIRVQRPKSGTFSEPYYVPPGFIESKGLLALKSSTVGAHTGFMQCDNVDVSSISGATERELQLIKNLLQTGIFINPASN